MANPWFRMYKEFAFDPKVQMLSEQDQRRFVMLLCLRCNDNVTLQDEEVTFQLRISNDEWQVTKSNLIAKKMIDENNSPTNWDKRQMQSDTSNERVKRYRERKKEKSNKDVTLQKQGSNGIEKEIDKEKDKEKDNKKREDAKKIIDRLNLKASKKFRHTDTNINCILPRLKEFSIDDCFYVIDVKTEEWLNTDMEKHLNAETLFRPKNFEKYLNQKRKQKQKGDFDIEVEGV